MSCTHPLIACRKESGEVIILGDTSRPYVNAPGDTFEIPCGQCLSCRLQRARDWSIRVMHEASLYDDNSFLTLTYESDDQISLDHKHFQDFMKRLRFGRKGISPGPRGNYPIRYYMCGEYGEENRRPHYHVCLFNFDFKDKIVWKRNRNHPLYRSKILESLWTHGFSTIGSLTPDSAAYTARYVAKKITGQESSSHYSITCPMTGEVTPIEPEYNRMSLRPGIAYDWINRYHSDLTNQGHLIWKGKPSPIPRYYDRFINSNESPVSIDKLSDLELIKFDKQTNSEKNNTPERRIARDFIKRSQFEKLERKL